MIPLERDLRLPRQADEEAGVPGRRPAGGCVGGWH